MSISGIGSSTSFDPTQMAQKFFKKADTNSDGSIDKSELKTMLSNGPGGNKNTQDIDKIFAEVDSNSDGKIDETENTNQMEKMAAKGGAQFGGAGGAPPTGGDSVSKTGASGGSSSSNQTKVYDPADTNKDGTVSFQEQMQYDLKHSEEAKNNSSANHPNSTTYNKHGNLDNGTFGTQSNFSLNA
jgi:Ca2+-binding EF-hand superfamily protein